MKRDLDPMVIGVYAFLGILLAGEIIGVTGACSGVANPSPVDVTAYASEQIYCVEQADSRATADTCRAASHTRMCARFPALSTCFDAGDQ